MLEERLKAIPRILSVLGLLLGGCAVIFYVGHSPKHMRSFVDFQIETAGNIG